MAPVSNEDSGREEIMNATSIMACAAMLVCFVGPSIERASAQPPQPGQPVTKEQIATAQALFSQMDSACSAGSKNKACGVLVYSPEDCTARKKDGHVRQVYATYGDHTLRFQQNNTGVARQRPMALLAPFGIIDRDGKSTLFADPQFVSWDEYEHGKKEVMVCGQKFRIEGKEFTLPEALKNFLKANP
jgi:hypothetical protein